MSAPTKTTDSPIKSPSGAESPTTVRPLEMDDDDVQESGVLSTDAPTGPKPATVEDALRQNLLVPSALSSKLRIP
ncbi:hypothetical protein LAWI1_G001065 [Lachnellula willkommii]|uniref:Uncharacterized protein n=1 Tax=Lachnellula willkommii TaxID=215461 RepID=A0A559MG94_9HELO|nr:hypothetical protein LAWI1_G001065 [Lachnellula willkommii]